MKNITIGFSPHRVEVLPFAREKMFAHQVIVLEEPPAPDFDSMLRGTVSISDYMLRRDSAFPKFDRKMCQLLRDIHHSGRRILQVEPFLERLFKIHHHFSQENGKADVMNTPELKEVYLAEKRATGALITFYAASVRGPFPKLIQALKAFARADAMRFDLRARLRAGAIAEAAASGEPMYVEAGYMHYQLYRHLRKALGRKADLSVAFLLSPVIRKLGGKRRNLGPGDVLTMSYALHNGPADDLADLLAARSLIYTKLIHKEELLPGLSEAPHSEDEVMINRLVDRLQFDDCQEIFPKIRGSNRLRALELVKTYVR